MTTRHQTRRIGIAASLAIAAFAGTALTGCTSGGTETKLTAADSPLFKLLGPLQEASSEDAMREQMRKVDTLIAQCMKDEGFQYTPTDTAGATFASDDSAERETEKWVAEHGYGISESTTTSDTPSDPNEEYVASLSETEKAAYHQALDGRQPDEEPTEGERDPETAGCAYNAYLEVQGPANVWQDQKFASLFQDMSTLWTKADSSPEVKAADASWADCMADAGHSGMKKQQDAMDEFMDKRQKLIGDEDGSGATGTSAPTAKELKALQKEEIELALADFRCSAKVGHTDIKRKVSFALEEKFIAAHKAELDELLDTYGDKK
ncbi:hypothetical protein ACPPVW_08440 [Leifsonia sp. McL0607]|uniref:hypothetical protein n=1 Tax=Leifsonia sp. McL0607 TaxID=3415672 RepID=UPI003CEDB70B